MSLVALDISKLGLWSRYELCFLYLDLSFLGFCSTRKKLEKKKKLHVISERLSFYVWQYVILNVADNQCKNNFQCNLEVKCFSRISHLGGISQHGIQRQKVHFVNLLHLHLLLASLCDLTPWSLSVLLHPELQYFGNIFNFLYFKMLIFRIHKIHKS